MKKAWWFILIILVILSGVKKYVAPTEITPQKAKNTHKVLLMKADTAVKFHLTIEIFRER